MFWRLWEGGPLYWLVKGLQIAVPLVLIAGTDYARRHGVLPQLDDNLRQTSLLFSLTALGMAIASFHRGSVFGLDYRNLEGVRILVYAVTLGLALYYTLGFKSLAWFG